MLFSWLRLRCMSKRSRSASEGGDGRLEAHVLFNSSFGMSRGQVKGWELWLVDCIFRPLHLQCFLTAATGR